MEHGIRHDATFVGRSLHRARPREAQRRNARGAERHRDTAKPRAQEVSMVLPRSAFIAHGFSHRQACTPAVHEIVCITRRATSRKVVHEIVLLGVFTQSR